jgi:signal transduction histidine kinase
MDAPNHLASAVQRELQLLEKITGNVASPISYCSSDLRYVFVNKAYANFIGRPSSEIMGRPIREMIGHAAYETILPHMERVLRGERVEYETEIPFPGIGPRCMEVVYVPDIGPDAVCGWFAGMTDVTDLRREQQHKDEMVATLAHELRNPLGGMRNSVEILKLARDDSQMAKAAVEILDRQVRRLASIVDNLLDLSWLKQLESRRERLRLVPTLDGATDDKAHGNVIPMSSQRGVS